MSSNDYFLLIICCVTTRNKLFCINISYCEVKLKWINIVFVLKTRKHLLKFEDKLPGKIMLLHGINDNMLISHPSYLGVYQDESKNDISANI